MEQEEIVHTDVSFQEFISEKGFMFQVLFYIFFALFTIPLIIGLIFAIFRLHYTSLIIGGFWLALLIYYIKKRLLPEALTILFIPYILSFIGLPMAQIFIPVSNTAIYTLIIVFSSIMGLVMAFMLDKVHPNFKSFVHSGVFFSTILAIVFAISAGIIKYVTILGEKLIELSANNPSAMMLSFFNISTLNPTIAFILAFVFFKISFFMFYFKKEDINKKKLLLYAIPIIVFILATLGILNLVDMILSRIIIL